MKNKKKKPSVIKNILVVAGCMVFAAAYALAALFIYAYVACDIGIEDYTAFFDTSEDALQTWSEEEPQADESDKPYTIEQEPRYIEETPSGTEASKEPQTDDTDTDTAEEKEKETKKSDIEIGSVQTIEQGETATAVVTDVTEVVKAAMPCVVAITNLYTAYDYWYGEEYEEEASGSGIIISQNDEELLILTNYHVVEDANTLLVKFVDDTEVTAYTKGTASDEDLAVVSVMLEDIPDETAEAIAIAVLGDSDALEVGEPAIAIGNSLGYGQSVTTGVISALNCTILSEYEEYAGMGALIQTDAAINPGNSGGALLNINGEVVGINSSKIADYTIEGMGYAIPINTAKPIVDKLVTQETKRKVAEDKRAFLGISGTDVTEEAMYRYGMPQGVYVASVLDGTAAQEAGLETGDIITALDGTIITSMTGLQGLLEYYEAGSEVEITYQRFENGGYKEITASVTLGLKE